MRCFIIILFSLSCYASDRNYAVQCTGDFDSKGCRSYNQMIAAKDRGLLLDLGLAKSGAICFSALGDAFTTVTFPQPKEVKDEGQGIRRASGFLGFRDYLEGVSHDNATFIGTWTELQDELSFSGRDSLYPESAAFVTSSEISVWFLGRHFSLRLSTMRYSQSYAIRLPDGQFRNVTDTGNCAPLPGQ